MQKPLFDSEMPQKQAESKIVNVASVPMRSPFRYAGGKTWLVPRIRLWLHARGGAGRQLIEPFAGGGIVSLTAVFENLVDHAIMVERDEGVAAVWRTITGGDARWLADRIVSFELNREQVRRILAQTPGTDRELAFVTLLKNRVNRGGILADGAGLVKRGENDRGLRSRWYPTTLKRRIMEIDQVRHKLTFIEGDGPEVCRQFQEQDNVIFFIDPPYTRAGRRLYRYSDIDHPTLFALAGQLKGDFLMTYDNAAEIQHLARIHHFESALVPMKSTHHTKKMELLIGRDLAWLQE